MMMSNWDQLKKKLEKIGLQAGAYAGDSSIWFKCCHNDDNLSLVKHYLDNGFNPDARDSQGRSGLVHAAEGSHNFATSQISELLLSALEKKYKNDPCRLLSAVTDGNPTYSSDHPATKTIISIIKMRARIAIGDPDVWFDSCHSDDHYLIVREFLERGFDPDARDRAGYSGLYHAAQGSNAYMASTTTVCNLLLDALERKYANDSLRLLNALTDGHPRFDDMRIKARIKNIKQKVMAALSNSVAVSQAPERVIPPSVAPLPIKLDRTVTATKLGQVASSGQTNLIIIANQGRLGEVFTPEVWSGRREEMEEAWKKVPEDLRNQVNIEVVRGQLSQTTAREKFNVKDNSWGQGF